jgi:hypothetical protein
VNELIALPSLSCGTPGARFTTSTVFAKRCGRFVFDVDPLDPLFLQHAQLRVAWEHSNRSEAPADGPKRGTTTGGYACNRHAGVSAFLCHIINCDNVERPTPDCDAQQQMFTWIPEFAAVMKIE